MRFCATDSVTVIPGCSARVSKLLISRGISTFGKLVAYNGPKINGIDNLCHLKKVVKNHLDGKVELSCHSWLGYTAHITRSKNRVTRVKIGNLLVSKHRILISVTWKERMYIRRKSVSPIALVCIQHLWTTSDIVSDDSGDDGCDPLEEFLPEFQINFNSPEVTSLNKDTRAALISLFKEISQFKSSLANDFVETKESIGGETCSREGHEESARKEAQGLAGPTGTTTCGGDHSSSSADLPATVGWNFDPIGGY